MTGKNYIFFNPREWRLIQGDHENARYERFYADHPAGGGLTEMVELSHFGNWYTRIGRLLKLEKNTTYHFVFWLNGGENDASTEICNLLVLYLDSSDEEISREEWENRCIYRLNRSYISPVKHCQGWELYDICFKTEQKENVLLCFEADKAPLALIYADSVEAYEDLEDEVDEFAARRPQRHNIIFSAGWPANSWYATEVLKRSAGQRGNCGSYSSLSEEVEDEIRDNYLDEISENLVDEVCENLADEIRDSHLGEISVAVCVDLADEIRNNHLEEICESIRTDFADEIRDNHLEEVYQGVCTDLADEIRDNHLEEVYQNVRADFADEIRDNHLEEICEDVIAELREKLVEQIRDNHLEEVCRDIMDDVRESLIEEIRGALH